MNISLKVIRKKLGHQQSHYPENGFQQVSFANSTETYDGGTHVDYIMSKL